MDTFTIDPQTLPDDDRYEFDNCDTCDADMVSHYAEQFVGTKPGGGYGPSNNLIRKTCGICDTVRVFLQDDLVDYGCDGWNTFMMPGDE
jgi:hypothetical protein